MTQQTLYFNYFKAVAINHVALAHSDARGQQVFDYADIESAFGKLRDGTKPQAWIMRLVMPRRSFRRENDVTQRVLDGGFLLAKYADARLRGDQAIIDAQDEVLEVADQIVERIVGDSRNGHPLFCYAADRADRLAWNAIAQANVGDGNYHGYFCTFEIANSFDSVGVCNPDAWTDGGLTDF